MKTTRCACPVSRMFLPLKTPVPDLFTFLFKYIDRRLCCIATSVATAFDYKMQHSLSFKSSQSPAYLSCHYQNATNSIQVVCISNTQAFFLERTVFPGQRLFFDAPASAVLKVRTGIGATTIATDSIPCHRLARSPLSSAAQSAQAA